MLQGFGFISGDVDHRVEASEAGNGDKVSVAVDDNQEHRWVIPHFNSQVGDLLH